MPAVAGYWRHALCLLPAPNATKGVARTAEARRSPSSAGGDGGAAATEEGSNEVEQVHHSNDDHGARVRRRDDRRSGDVRADYRWHRWIAGYDDTMHKR